MPEAVARSLRRAKMATTQDTGPLNPDVSQSPTVLKSRSYFPVQSASGAYGRTSTATDDSSSDNEALPAVTQKSQIFSKLSPRKTRFSDNLESLGEGARGPSAGSAKETNTHHHPSMEVTRASAFANDKYQSQASGMVERTESGSSCEPQSDRLPLLTDVASAKSVIMPSRPKMPLSRQLTSNLSPRPEQGRAGAKRTDESGMSADGTIPTKSKSGVLPAQDAVAAGTHRHRPARASTPPYLHHH